MNTASVDNILAVYHRADDDAIAQGMSWYDDARAFASSLDNLHRSAGVIAALSPNQNWKGNKTLARAFYAGHPRGLSRSVANATAIYNGTDPMDVLGPKTKSFYLNIVDPTIGAVTIDRHAFDIAVGRVTDDATRKVLSRKGVYDYFRSLYISAAASCGQTNVSPAQVQAITWIQWRRDKR